MSKLDIPIEIEAEFLDKLRIEFESGKKSALFAAIRFCGNQQAVMPEWVVEAFFKATNRWFGLQCRTLDEAFGVKWPKGKQLNAARKKRRLMFAVKQYADELRSQGRSINDNLFRDVGGRFHIGKTLAEEYYYAAIRALEPTPSSAVLDNLLEPFMTPEAKRARSTRKVSKLRGKSSRRS